MRATKRLLAAMFLVGLVGCKEPLYSRLSEQEANDMVLVLQMSGISVSKERLDEKTWEVRVPPTEMASALAALKEAGMPKVSHTEIGDLFKKQGLVSSPFEQRIRYLHGVSQELSHTLSQIDGVVTARVHIVIPQPGGDAGVEQKASASVFIKHRKEVNLQSQAIAIKQIVANGVDGLDYDNISLALFPTTVSTEGHKFRPPMEGLELPMGVQALSGVALVVAGLLIAFFVGSGRGSGGFAGMFRSSRSRGLGDSTKKASGG